MKKHTAETKRGHHPGSSTGVVDEPVESATPSATAVAAEALRTGVVPLATSGRRVEVPGHVPGESDMRALDAESVGDQAPGGSMTTPDQNSVDEIGRAYGLQEEDNGGPLRTSAEILDHRDHHREELQAPGPREKD